MAGDILGVSVSGALASQRALTTTGHNIANANTEGYTRQRVELDARAPQLSSNGAIGQGVAVTNVERVLDEFVDTEILENTSVSESLNTKYEFTSQVDNMLSDPKSGLGSALQSFFAAVNSVANDPSSASARQVMLSESRSLGDRFEYLNGRFSSLREGVNKDIRNIVVNVNDIAAAIAKINDTIVKAREIGGAMPNDLLDQRDRLVNELSKLVSVRVSEQDDGRMNVFIGNGQTLVINNIASELEVEGSRFDPDEVDIVFKGQGINSIVTKFLTGGRLGGLLEFKNGALNTSQNELGRIAIGIAKTFNEQHRLGMDLNSELGANFFNESDKLTPKVLPHIRNKGDIILRAEITDIDKLEVSDYSLAYREGKYALIRVNDDKLIGTYDSLPVEVDDEGFRLIIDSGGNIQTGDKFIIRPTREGADNFGTSINNVAKIAAASPLRTEALISNMGDAEISAAVVVDTNNVTFSSGNKLNPPFVIRFVDDTHFEILDNSGNAIAVKSAAVPARPAISANEKGHAEPATPATPAQPPSITTLIAYDPDSGTDVFPTPDGQDFGFRVRITGQPKAGDSFRIEFNKDGIGDNTNAIKLAQLQTTPILSNSTTDYAQAYAQLISRVGSKTHELDVNSKAQELLLQQAIQRREAVSGVNMDEEAANMMRYQNLYQANAKVISVANKLLEELLNSFR